MPKSSTSFKKGEVHNPKGRPKKEMSVTTLLKQKLTPEIFAEAMANYIEKHKEDGNFDFQTLKLIWAYYDGMPVQNQKIENVGSNPILDLLKDINADK